MVLTSLDTGWLNILPGGVLICILVFGLIAYVRGLKSVKMLSTIPSWHNWPVVGDVLHMKLDQEGFYTQLMEAANERREQNMMHFNFAGKHWVFIFGSEEAGELLSSTDLIDKSDDYEFLHPWLGTGLLNSTGKKWHTRRKLLTPSFHFNILKDFLDIINDHALNLKEKLATYADTDKAFDIFPIITLSTLDIICATAMGVEVNAVNNSESEYVKAIYSVKEAIAKRVRSPWLWNDFIYHNIIPEGRQVWKSTKYMHKFSTEVIKDRRSIGSDSTQGNKRRAFLDMLLTCTDENGQHLSTEDIREEVDTFMFEGHDTTAAAVSFCLYLLASHPEELRKCQQEQDNIFENPREASTDDLRKMSYLEATIKEAMRVYPAVPWFGRQAVEEFGTKFAGHVIPKGATLMLFTSALHMDPKIFPNPHKFDPTRFLAENAHDRHPYAYVPFSAGIRNCIGQKFAMMELKVVISTIIKSFNITTSQKREELRPTPGLIIQAAGGIWLKFSSR